MYELSKKLPERERFNLCSQVERAATSIVLNIAEGSTGQSDKEQNRFPGFSLRSYLETIACLDLPLVPQISELLAETTGKYHTSVWLLCGTL